MSVSHDSQTRPSQPSSTVSSLSIPPARSDEMQREEMISEEIRIPIEPEPERPSKQQKKGFFSSFFGALDCVWGVTSSVMSFVIVVLLVLHEVEMLGYMKCFWNFDFS